MEPYIKQTFHVLINIFLALIAVFYISLADARASENFDDFDTTLPGVAEGVGTIFAVTASEYKNITLESSEKIYARIESMPETIILVVEPIAGVVSSEITIRGLDQNTRYYLYEDNYHNITPLDTDPSGSLSFIQKLEARHTIFIQPRASTLFLRDNASGGDCPLIGLWDLPAKTCTLTGDIADTIQIDNDNITLDGAGHTSTGQSTGNGIYIYGRRGVVVKNLTLTNFTYGIFLNGAASTTLEGNFLTANYLGLQMNATSNNFLKDNVMSHNRNMGIYIMFESGNNTLIGNAMFNNRPNFYIRSFLWNTFGNRVDTTNTVEGKPIYYMEDASGFVFEDIDNMGMFLCIRCNNITLRNVVIDDPIGDVGNETGIHFWHTDNSLIENAYIAGNGFGVRFHYSSNNVFRKNTLRNNLAGVLAHTAAVGNNLYNNNFLSNRTHMYISQSGVNAYHLPLPDGGNYWDTYDEENEGCFDANNDGFCDAPYKVYRWTNDTDDLPWTAQDGWSDSLILQYEPVLYLHPDENYEPMKVDAFVGGSSLWDDRGIFSDMLLKAESITDPVTLDYIATTTTGTEDWYLQFSGGSLEPKTFDPSAALLKYNELVSGGSARPAYYARKMEDSFVDDEGVTRAYIVLQYWYFYAFNDWKEHGGFNNHEGDWESVMVFLDKETQTPRYAAYSAHHNDGDPTFNFAQYDSVRRGWDHEDVQKDGDQVKSFVALGSHANYPNNGDGVHNTGTEDDLTSIEGNHLTSNIWENRVVIGSDLPRWVYYYEGKWGTDQNDIFGESSGPQGPNFITVGGTERFRNPIKWAGIDKVAEKTVTTPTDTLSFINQSTIMTFNEILPVGATVSVDLHDEFIGFGSNLDAITLLPRFWDIESSLDDGAFEATVKFAYNPSELEAWGINEDDLAIFFYDEANNKWQSTPSSLDAGANAVSFTATHFSRYAIGAYKWQSITEKVRIKKHWGPYQPQKGARDAFVSVKNMSADPLSGHIRLLITGIDEEGVYLVNNSGTTTDAMPYIDVLGPDEILKPVMLEFNLPIKNMVANNIYVPETQEFWFDVDVQRRLEP